MSLSKVMKMIKRECEIELPDLLKMILRNVRNPWVVFLCYVRKNKRMKARFYNGLEMDFDNSTVLRMYITCVLLSIGYRIFKTLDGDYLLIKECLKLTVGSPEDVGNFVYRLKKYYHVLDYSGKTVLDVGGYVGDTAVLFWRWGAKKIIVYEPLEENLRYLRINIALNKIDAEVHQFAVCNRCGQVTINVDKGSIGTRIFGLVPGKHKFRLNGISWNEVLKEAIRNNVEIAKVDCEGCEKFLLDACKDEIREIPYWVIESHNRDTDKALVEMFSSLGFNHKVIQHPSFRDFHLSVFFFDRCEC